MLSTVPGLTKPSAFLRSERLEYASIKVAEMTLSVRKAREEADFSSTTSIVDRRVRGSERETMDGGERDVEGDGGIMVSKIGC